MTGHGVTGGEAVPGARGQRGAAHGQGSHRVQAADSPGDLQVHSLIGRALHLRLSKPEGKTCGAPERAANRRAGKGALTFYFSSRGGDSRHAQVGGGHNVIMGEAVPGARRAGRD